MSRLPQPVERAYRWFWALLTNSPFWKGAGVVLITLAGLYLLFNWWVMPSYTRHDVAISVPRATNYSFGKAEELLEQHGLRVERQRAQRFNPNIPRGEVMDQNPPPKALVKPGRRVYLTVNVGQTPTVRMPDLSGISVREAQNRLTALGLSPGAVQPDSIPAPYPNTITNQEPAPSDSIDKGSTVDLWYSQGLGEAVATVPDVTGLTIASARDTLLGRRLRAVVVGAPSDSAYSDSLRVGAQSRSAGTTVREGVEIRLFTRPESHSSAPSPADRAGSGSSGRSARPQS